MFQRLSLTHGQQVPVILGSPAQALAKVVEIVLALHERMSPHLQLTKDHSYVTG